MKHYQLILWAAIGCVIAPCSETMGQAVISKTEPIDVELDPGLSTADYSYPNVFDLDHPKLLKFEAMVDVREIVNEGMPKLEVKFDWLSKDGKATNWTTPKSFDLQNPGPTKVSLEFMVPFCPSTVSLHLELVQGAVFAHVKGTFTHECVPEADAVVPVGALLLAMAGWRLVVNSREHGECGRRRRYGRGI